MEKVKKNTRRIVFGLCALAFLLAAFFTPQGMKAARAEGQYSLYMENVLDSTASMQEKFYSKTETNAEKHTVYLYKLSFPYSSGDTNLFPDLVKGNSYSVTITYGGQSVTALMNYMLYLFPYESTFTGDLVMYLDEFDPLGMDYQITVGKNVVSSFRVACLYAVYRTPSSAGITEDGVYTSAGEQLYYLPTTNEVFTADAKLVIDHRAISLKYENGRIVNGVGEEAEITKDSDTIAPLSSGGTGDTSRWVARIGRKDLASVSQSDDYYIVDIIPGKLHANPNGLVNDYQMYAKRVGKTTSSTFWTSVWLAITGQMKVTVEYEYYDLLGQRIPDAAIANKTDKQATYTYSRLVGSGGKLPVAELVGDLQDVLVAIGHAPPTENAVQNENGYILDDRLQAIEKGVNGQLTDKVYPLVSDAWPVTYVGNSYYDFWGKPLTVNAGNQLVNESGVPVHSVVTDILKGELLYFLTLHESNLVLPATAVNLGDGKFEFYDLKGKKITSDNYVPVVVNETDRKEQRPEEYPEETEKTFWDWLAGLFGANGSNNSGNGCTDVINGCATVGAIIIVIMVLIILAIIISKIKGKGGTS